MSFEQYNQLDNELTFAASSKGQGVLLDAIATAGLPPPVVAFDCSLSASGSLANAGSDGGTLDPVGTPTYGNAFPSTVGGTAVGFDSVSTDGFSASSSSIAEPAANESVAVFAVFSATSTGANTLIAEKRGTSFGSGWEMRLGGTGIPTVLVEDDGGDAVTVTGSGNHADGNDNYIGFSADLNDGNLYASSNIFAEGSASIAAHDDYGAARALSIGLGGRDAFGNGSGLVRHLAVWTGSDAEGIRESDWDSLFTALGGTL